MPEFESLRWSEKMIAFSFLLLFSRGCSFNVPKA